MQKLTLRNAAISRCHHQDIDASMEHLCDGRLNCREEVMNWSPIARSLHHRLCRLWQQANRDRWYIYAVGDAPLTQQMNTAFVHSDLLHTHRCERIVYRHEKVMSSRGCKAMRHTPLVLYALLELRQPLSQDFPATCTPVMKRVDKACRDMSPAWGPMKRALTEVPLVVCGFNSEIGAEPHSHDH